MKKTKKFLALFLSVAILVGIGINNGSMIIANAGDFADSTVATVGTTEYTADEFEKAIVASTEENPVVIQKDFEYTDLIWFSKYGSPSGIFIDLNNHRVELNYYRQPLPMIRFFGDIPIKIYGGGTLATGDSQCGILEVFENDSHTPSKNTIEITDCTLETQEYADFPAIDVNYNCTLILDNCTINGDICCYDDYDDDTIYPTLIIKNQVTMNYATTKVFIIEENATLTSKGIEASYIPDGISMINNGTIVATEYFQFYGEEKVAKAINNGSMTVGRYGFENYPSSCEFTNNGIFDCKGNCYFYQSSNITNAETGTMNIGGNLTLLDHQENGVSSITNDGVFTVLGNINNETSITNNALMYMNDTTEITGNEIGGTGNTYRMITIPVSADIDVPKTSTALDTSATLGDSSKYSAEVEYYIGSEKVTGENAEYNKEYTAKITLTPANGYIFFEKPTATINGTEPDSTVLNENKTVTLTYTFPATVKNKMTGIAPLDPFEENDNGISNEQIAEKLPSEITITTEVGDQKVKVQWDVSNLDYDTNSKESQTFEVPGTVELPEDIDQNGQSLSTSIMVTVKAKVEDTTTTKKDDNTTAKTDDEKTTKKDDSKTSPKTGEEMQILLFSVFFLASGLGIVCVSKKRKKAK